MEQWSPAQKKTQIAGEEENKTTLFCLRFFFYLIFTFCLIGSIGYSNNTVQTAEAAE